MGINIPDFTLDHPRVRVAKASYERRHPLARKKGITFEKLFYCYRSLMNYCEISTELGVSREFASKAYRHFKPFCDNRTAKERLSAKAKKQKAVLQARAELQEPVAPEARAVFEQARAYGYVARSMSHYIQRKASWHPYTRRIRINWRPCVVYWAHKAVRIRGSREYARFFITGSSLENIDAVILYISAPGHQERFFIIPVSVLQQTIFRSGREREFLNVPLKGKRVKGGARPRLNLSAYENAWQLLQAHHTAEGTPT